MSLSPAQLAIRREGITATDVAAIVGVHPYRTALDVWLEKTGQAKPFAGNVRTKWGELLEPVIRDDFAERHGLRVEVCGTLSHPKIPWRKATPDGLCYRPDGTLDRGLEIKVHSRDAMWRTPGFEYGDPGTDDIPLWELTQCMWGLDIVGVQRWDLCAFVDGSPTDYVVRRDDEAVRVLGEVCHRFLVDHIHGNKPPPPNGSERYTEWLRDRWDKNTDDIIRIDDRPEVLADVESLKALRAQASELDAQIEATVQRLKLVIGEKLGLEWASGRKKPHRITWRFSRAATWVDYAGLMAEMRNVAAFAAAGQFREFERAITCLETAPQLENSRATITPAEVIALLKSWRETLTAIARADMEPKYKHTKKAARPFVVPRSWKSPKGTEEQSE